VNRRVTRGLVLGAALGGLAAVGGCSHDGPGEGEARAEVAGLARVSFVSGKTETVTGGRTLHRGDQIEVLEGTVRLLLPNGAELEGRAAREGMAAPTKLKIADVPELQTGEVLMTASDGVAVVAAGTRVDLEATDDEPVAARVARTLAVAATAYTGTVTIDSAGLLRTVPPLREMEVPALGRPPAAPRPLTYDDADPWDLRYLREAIELGRQLEGLAKGYTDNLQRDEGRTVGFFQLLLPALDEEPAFTPDLLEPPHSPGDTLIGAAIASLGRRGTFAERWKATFAFKDAGAKWGLVALDQGVDRGPLMGTVEQALSATSFEFAAVGGPSTSPSTASAATSPNTTSPSGSPTPSATSTTDSSTSSTGTTAPPPTTPPPVDAPVPPTGVPIIDDAVDPVEDLIGGIIGGGGG